jgi:hypothetical protein
MTRNLKALGVALVAVFAMAAMAASAASAVQVDHFTSLEAKTIVTGVSHDNKFTVTPSTSFECTTSKFYGTFLNGATEATAEPVYEGIKNETPHTNPKCTASIGQVTVHMNGCDYNLTATTSNEHPTGSGKFDAPVWIICPVGQEITITGPLGCVIHVHAQTPTSGGVTYTNLPNHAVKKAIQINVTVTGITFTATNCIGLPAEGNDADYTGSVIVTGYKDNNANTLLTTPVTEGPQTGIEVSTTP